MNLILYQIKDLLAKEINDLNLYDDDHIENNEKIEYLKEAEGSLHLKRKKLLIQKQVLQRI